MTHTLTVPPGRQAAPPALGYQQFAASSLIISEQLCEAVDLRAGWRVLDVGSGTGNATLAAARRCCTAVGVDVLTEGAGRAALRAEAEGLETAFVGGDALCLPFADASFDAVLSILGVIWAGDQRAAADELLRVCRPGGRIGLANWTCDGWTAAFFQLLGRLGPAQPAGRMSPFRWGSETGLRALFGGRLAGLAVNRRTFYARHYSPESFWAFVQSTNGFVRARLDAVSPDVRTAFEREVLALVGCFNRAGDGTAVIAQDYLEIVATTRR